MTTPLAARGYLRSPTICRDSVVFCCEDDLWHVPAAGGAASRLTAGISEASHPRLSPGADLVAFVGADDGPTEVYLLALSGGPPRRLTYQGARCVVVGWHPGTGEVIYASTAEQPADFGWRLFAVDPDGGAPRLLHTGPANAVSHGPAGGLVLGRSIADPARRKRYRGGAAGELWVDRAGTGEFVRLPCPPGNLAAPCWVGDRIYFISDHDGVGNVYSLRPDGTGLAGHSEHGEFYARNLSTDGRRLVYQTGAQLYLLDPAQGQPRMIEARLATSRTQQARRFVPAADYLDSVVLRPDGAGLALVSRGKPFTFDHWSGPVRQHGAADGVRYRLLSPIAAGARLAAVAADERSDERIVVLPAEDGAGGCEMALDGLGCVTELVCSPATGHVAFATNRQQLWIVDTAAASPVPRPLDSCPYERIEDLAWSPDGRWLAYTYPDSPCTSAIKLADVRTGRTVQLTHPVLRDSRPAFDPLGRYLYFIGQRHLTAEYDQVHFDVGFPFGARPYLITLRADEQSPFVPGPVVPGTDGAGGSDGADGVASPDVDIDFDGIQRRIVALPVAEGRYASVVGLRDRVLLLSVPVAAPDPSAAQEVPPGTVTMIDLGTGEICKDYLERVDQISADARGRAVLYRSGHRLRVLDAAASEEDAAEHDTPWARPGRPTGWIDLDRVQVPVRPGTEWRQMFREAWRLQREAFWNEAMSGVDWAAMYERYAPMVDLVASRSELSDLLWELQGELGASHAYERGGDHRRPDPQPQGHLGVDWAAPAEGGPPSWCIERIVVGDPWDDAATSPCNRPGTDIRPGDEVVAVNGQRVGRRGPAELLVAQAGREVELSIARAGCPTRAVAVRAIGDESRARYLDWTESNRRYVRAISQGRLGYLHVPDMFCTGYADFMRGFLAELDRDGLIVDVRSNGGGNISPLLLDLLARRRGGAEHGRWSGVAPYPLESPRGPMAVLIDEQTGSDGELFAHLFRDRGLGALIGRRTWGGTIATWPRHELVDGSVTTQPEYCYVLRDVGSGLENRGVEPDVEVENPPSPEPDGADPDLTAAVRHLLAGRVAWSPAASPQPAARAAARAASERR